MDPIGTFRRRAAKRIIRDLPLDLAETELDDPLGLLRGKVRASLDSAQRWERGKAAPARRAWFGIPSVPDISRLTSVAAALREILHRLHGEHMAVRSAAETLSSHMEGLVRQVCQRMSHAGTYGRGGLAGADGRGGVQVVSSVDVRS